jgi:steroid 5-alpha reductase family enzyme
VAVREILTVGHPLLRERAREVTADELAGQEMQTLIDDLIDTMHAANGAGIAFGWLLVLVTTFLLNHFELFGLRQVWLHPRGRPYTALPFKTPGPYRLVRHPLYVGWFFAFWATPTMTATHLLFAVMTTAYILVAIRLDRRTGPLTA